MIACTDKFTQLCMCCLLFLFMSGLVDRFTGYCERLPPVCHTFQVQGPHFQDSLLENFYFYLSVASCFLSVMAFVTVVMFQIKLPLDIMWEKDEIDEKPGASVGISRGGPVELTLLSFSKSYKSTHPPRGEKQVVGHSQNLNLLQVSHLLDVEFPDMALFIWRAPSERLLGRSRLLGLSMDPEIAENWSVTFGCWMTSDCL